MLPLANICRKHSFGTSWLFGHVVILLFVFGQVLVRSPSEQSRVVAVVFWLDYNCNLPSEPDRRNNPGREALCHRPATVAFWLNVCLCRLHLSCLCCWTEWGGWAFSWSSINCSCVINKAVCSSRWHLMPPSVFINTSLKCQCAVMQHDDDAADDDVAIRRPSCLHFLPLHWSQTSSHHRLNQFLMFLRLANFFL